jgi:hypothetical protein
MAWLHLFMPLHAAEDNSLPQVNRAVIDAVHSMPQGGRYATSPAANRALSGAVSREGSLLSVHAAGAFPSYCSGATYLVFLKALSDLQTRGGLTLSPETIAALRPAGQPDGTGIWGRWNANGPGTARLFHELGLGPNFTDLSAALPGDFLKIFWNDAIGASEHGHSVIFLTHDPKAGTLTFWSSNIPGGYGSKTVPLSRIHRLLFSRLEHPENLNRPLLPQTDAYLSSLVHHSSSPGEMARQSGLDAFRQSLDAARISPAATR